jgi:hypothetical protein
MREGEIRRARDLKIGHKGQGLETKKKTSNILLSSSNTFQTICSSTAAGIGLI